MAATNGLKVECKTKYNPNQKDESVYETEVKAASDYDSIHDVATVKIIYKLDEANDTPAPITRRWI